MRFYYLDPGLKSNVGHHANTCRAVVSELRRRGIDTVIAASVELVPEFKIEIGAIPFFDIYTYAPPHPDPIAGWLKTFLDGVAMTTVDLGRLPQTTADDVAFVNSAQPIQLMAVMTWLNGIPPERRPRVVVEFGTDAGVAMQRTDQGYTIDAVDPREDPRSVLFRHAGKNIPDDFRSNLFLTTFDASLSKIYQSLLGYETGVLPLPQQGYGPPQKRVGKRPITIGVLGHQREEKGYQAMPDVIAALLARHADIQILVHNSLPEEMWVTQEAIRDLAKRDSRVIVDEQPSDAQRWQELLSRIDLVLCPYRAARYLARYSAIAVDALANGLPIVAPAGTTMQWFTTGNNGAITTFGTFAPTQIAEATSKAIEGYDELATKAQAAAEAWNRQDRKALLVDALLGERHTQATVAGR